MIRRAALVAAPGGDVESSRISHVAREDRRRLRAASALLLSPILAWTIAASSAWADTGSDLRPHPLAGRPVSARIVRPGAGASLPGGNREVGIGRERDEASFRALKQPRPERVRLGGRERFADGNVMPPLRDAGAGYAGPQQFFSVPYDAALAVGRTQVLVMTNNQFAVYDRVSGVRRASALINEFFGAAAGGGYDPKCYYDPGSDRYVMVVLEWATQPERAQIDLAVSRTGDAAGAWFHYVYDAGLTGATPTHTWSDFPGLGYDDRHVYLATNQFRFNGRFAFPKLRVWSKAELYAGQTARFVDFAHLRHADGAPAFALKPARSLSPTIAGRLLATRSEGGASVSTWMVTGAFPDLALSPARTVAIGPYRVGPDARQPGSTIRVDTGDCRTQDVVWRDGHWYTAFTERRGSGRAAVTALRYLDVTDAGAAVRDVTYFAAGAWLFYPAVSAGPAGDVAMVFGRASPAEYASVYQTRLPAGGAFESSRRLSAGVAAHTRQRWGDYNAAANDPVDPSRIWVYGGYGIANDRWATWIASLDPAVAGGAPALLALDDDADENDSAADDVRLRAIALGPRAIRFTFELTVPCGARLDLFDLSGRRVAVLIDRDLAAGVHTVEWDGRASWGVRAAAGNYWGRLATPLGARTARVTLEH